MQRWNNFKNIGGGTMTNNQKMYAARSKALQLNKFNRSGKPDQIIPCDIFFRIQLLSWGVKL
jgi:hypothetical protein